MFEANAAGGSFFAFYPYVLTFWVIYLFFMGPVAQSV